LFVAMAIAGAVRGRADMRAPLLVNWLVIAMVATAAAYAVPGASFPTLLPAVAFAVVGWIETFARRRLSLAGWTGFAVVSFLLINFVMALEVVLSFSLTQYKILVLFPVVLALVPVFVACLSESAAPAWLLSGVSAAVVAAAAAVASQAPAYAADHPRGVDVVYYDDKAAKPRWLIQFIGGADETYLHAQGFPAEGEILHPLGLMAGDRLRMKPAKDLDLPPPTLTATAVTTANGVTTMHGTLKAGRSGFIMGIGVAPGSGIKSIAYDGEVVTSPEKLAGKDPVVTRLMGFGSRDVAVEITFDAKTVPEVVLYELSPLPQGDETSALVAGRPEDAAPAYRGDCATVFKTEKVPSVVMRTPEPQ
jgi:hypothetical protein